MPTPTYVPLANVTLASATASVTLSSIPATYRDLVLTITGTSTTGAIGPRIRLNSDSGSNYFHVVMSGNGSTTVSAAFTETYLALGYNAAFTTGTGFNSILQFMDYSATDKHKTILVRAGNADTGSPGTDAEAFRWANTAIITSLAVTPSSSTFAAGSTFNLYGIAS